MTEPTLAYLDASALVKLAWREPETEALLATLSPDVRLVASEIAEVEVLRALRRRGAAAEERGRQELESVRLLPLSRQIRRRACELEPTTLRVLDAIHVATALHLGELLHAFYAYDGRLLEAARRFGLRVMVPSVENPAGAAPLPADGPTADAAHSTRTDADR